MVRSVKGENWALNGYLTITGGGEGGKRGGVGTTFSYEPRREKTGFLHMRKQRRRSARS